LRLVWGDGEAALALVRKMIASEGIGIMLKDGVKRAAERLGKGSEAFAVHAGGQELAMHDPRFDAGYGLAYEVEPTPGRHTIHSYTYTDLMALHKKTRRVPKQALMHTLKDRLGVKGKGETQAVVSRYMDVANGCGLCLFGLSIGGNPPLVEWINAATGWKLGFEEYLTVGHRIKTLRHAFNLREGIRPEDTTMTPRPRGIPPLEEGPLKGFTPPFDELRRDFYRAMGWDADTARPLGATLARLGLHDVKAALDR
jgi:aldehyde:ferredoxin oxidoreductase